MTLEKAVHLYVRMLVSSKRMVKPTNRRNIFTKFTTETMVKTMFLPSGSRVQTSKRSKSDCFDFTVKTVIVEANQKDTSVCP